MMNGRDCFTRKYPKSERTNWWFGCCSEALLLLFLLDDAYTRHDIQYYLLRMNLPSDLHFTIRIASNKQKWEKNKTKWSLAPLPAKFMIGLGNMRGSVCVFENVEFL